VRRGAATEEREMDQDELQGSTRAWVLAVLAGIVLIGSAGGLGMWMTVRSDPMAAVAAPTSGMVHAGLDLATVPKPIADHYRFAADHLSLYADVPCYCGCDVTLGHRSLADCFVRADGAGWDPHAAGCAVCTDESTIVRHLEARGRSPDQIRSAVIARYAAPPAPASGITER
jgi:hypothetical protein